MQFAILAPSARFYSVPICLCNLNYCIKLEPTDLAERVRRVSEWDSEVPHCLWELTWDKLGVVFAGLGQQINPIKKIDTKNFILWYHTFGENRYIKFRIKIRQITIKSLGKYVMHRRDFYSYPILCWIWIYDQKFTSLQLAVTRIIVNCGRKTSRY